jgi:hypothetical protein
MGADFQLLPKFGSAEEIFEAIGRTKIGIVIFCEFLKLKAFVELAYLAA